MTLPRLVVVVNFQRCVRERERERERERDVLTVVIMRTIVDNELGIVHYCTKR
jgi:hypothetical protein